MNNNNYTINKEGVILKDSNNNNITFDIDKTYNIIFLIEDTFEPVTVTRLIETSFVLMDFNTSGQSMAIGKISEATSSEQKLEIALDTNFTKTIKKNGVSIFELVYPIGSIYMSVNDVSPGNLFGGTWERIKDKFLLSAGDTYEAGSTGGEATHTLTIDEIPSHTHQVKISADTGWNSIGKSGGTESTNGASYPTGGGQAHNNMPPYLAVYMWKRTA